ncbi:unnamed protein product, partial [Mesorhabditis spiculigera]
MAEALTLELKESLIEKQLAGVTGEYRSIRLDEWRNGDKIHRNWTYINCEPLMAGEVLSRPSTPAAVKSTTTVVKKSGKADPPSPKERRRKQDMVLARELAEMEEDEKRRKQRAKSQPKTERTCAEPESTEMRERQSRMKSVMRVAELLARDPDGQMMWRQMADSVHKAALNIRQCKDAAGRVLKPGEGDECERMINYVDAEVAKLTKAVLPEK